MMQMQILLRRADRDLLKRVHEVALAALDDTPETLADPARKIGLEELLADLAEELGAKVVEDPVEPPKARTVKLMDGREIPVR